MIICRMLSSKHVDCLIKFEESIAKKPSTPVHDSSFFQLSTKEKVQNRFENDSLVIGVYQEMMMIGYSVLSFYHPSKSNQFAFGNQRIALLEYTLITPEYRGHGLQRMLIEIRQEEAEKQKCGAVYAVVDSNNEISKRNLIRSGMKIISNHAEWEGKTGVLLFKNLALNPYHNQVRPESNHTWLV